MVKAFSEFNGAVHFGGVNIGVAAASIGIKIDRGVIPLSKADEMFCNRRLIGQIILGNRNDAEGQQLLVKDTDHVVSGAFDIKKFQCSKKQIGVTASFSIEDIDIAELAGFASGTGRLVVSEVGEIPEPEKAEKNAADAVPGTLKAEGPWRNHPLDELFDPKKAVRKALAKAGINTVGELADYSASEKRLTDIDDIGPGKAQEIEDVMLEFWRSNPDADAQK